MKRKMITSSHNVKIQHLSFGVVLNETFVNPTQFKLFLKMIQGCIEMKQDLTFFNGSDFLIHVPFEHLVKSIVVTSVDEISFTDVVKSKVEALETK